MGAQEGTESGIVVANGGSCSMALPAVVIARLRFGYSYRAGATDSSGDALRFSGLST